MEEFEIKNRRYLGSKARLLSFIDEVVKENCSDINVFLDLFAGTGNVAWSFNDKKISIIVNDILESNYLSYLSFFGNESIDENKIQTTIKKYNNIKISQDNYFSSNFADTYFSKENTRKIGFIRNDIEFLFEKNDINVRERAILITSLIYAMDSIANTVGHYDAFRLNGDLDKPLVLKPLALPKIGTNNNNQIYKLDANVLVKKIAADLVYIDPPYNSRQYSDAYHLLENIAEWKKPKVYGVARKMDRTKIKSRYSMSSATNAFEDLINNIDSKYILVSYNNMGNKGASRSQAKISDKDIVRILSDKGTVKIFEKEFNQFTTGKTSIDNHKERLFLCEVGKKSNINLDEYSVDLGDVKSPLNYTGGKFKLLSQIKDKLPQDIETFVDLFGGGFNVGVNIESKLTIYNDNQREVTRLNKLFYTYSYKQIINRLEKIIDKYDLSKSNEKGYEYYNCNSNNGLGSYNKKGYYNLREEYNSYKTYNVERDFLLLTLIIYSFNNQIRFNSHNKFNMPVGKRDLNNSVRKNISEFSQKMKTKNIEFYTTDFDELKLDEYKKPFIYCDPPYLLGTAAYNENGGWNEKDEKKLLSYLKELDDKGVKFALSNVIEHKGQVHKALKDWIDINYFNTTFIKSNYNNSNYQTKSKNNKTVEVLITNY